MSYRLIEELQKKAIPISQACGALGISRSGYYAARTRRAVAPVLCAALQMAIVQRNPAPGLMVHSDRRTQYASAAH